MDFVSSRREPLQTSRCFFFTYNPLLRGLRLFGTSHHWYRRGIISVKKPQNIWRATSAHLWSKECHSPPRPRVLLSGSTRTNVKVRGMYCTIQSKWKPAGSLYSTLSYVLQVTITWCFARSWRSSPCTCFNKMIVRELLSSFLVVKLSKYLVKKKSSFFTDISKFLQKYIKLYQAVCASQYYINAASIIIRGS